MVLFMNWNAYRTRYPISATQEDSMTTKTDTTTMILVTWHDYSRQAFPRTLETLDYLVAHADGYESIEEVEVVTFTAEEVTA